MFVFLKFKAVHVDFKGEGQNGQPVNQYGENPIKYDFVK
jgi:hypothetical protein